MKEEVALGGLVDRHCNKCGVWVCRSLPAKGSRVFCQDLTCLVREPHPRSDRMRVITTLYLYANYSPQQIGELLGMQRQNVFKILSREGLLGPEASQSIRFKIEISDLADMRDREQRRERMRQISKILGSMMRVDTGARGLIKPSHSRFTATLPPTMSLEEARALCAEADVTILEEVYPAED